MEIKAIITGVTGMVGEGVLFECLEHADVTEVLIVNRRHYDLEHSKLKELIVPNFLNLEDFEKQLAGYNACFYCAGVSSIGLSESEYTNFTYDTTMHFASTLARLNADMTFDFVSGSGTDSSEKGRLMWARVKGKTENDLMKLPFKAVYCFRPGLMKPIPGQKNIKPILKLAGVLYPVVNLLFPGIASTLAEVGQAMINSVLKGYSKKVLEVRDIKALAKI